MPSDWFLFTDDEVGPLSLEAVAGKIARGELRHTDLARSGASADWRPIGKISVLQRAVGLFRSPPSHGSQSAAGQRSGGNLMSFVTRERLLVAAAVASLLVLAVQLAWWYARQPEAFPEGRRSLVMNVPNRAEQMRPPEPAVPTIPGLLRGMPQPVPGFEQVPWLKSPALSHDLLRIVYVTYTGEEGLDDLVFAQRSTVDAPFAQHRKLDRVNSPGREAQPALSPDGNELIFCRLGEPSRLWHARFDPIARDFAPPELLQLTGEHADEAQLDNPQFLNAHTIRVAGGDTAFTRRFQLIATRPRAGQPFAVTRELAIANPWPRYTANAAADRAYFPSAEGIQLSAFQTRSRQFVLPDVLLATGQVGADLSKFDDTIWVAPREDAIFYCSPGIEGGAAEDHRLWMVKP